MTAIERDGVRVDLPAGWEGKLYRRSDTPAPPGLQAAAGEVEPLILHAANFALPGGGGDFGGGIVETMGRGAVLVVLFEYDPASAGRGLFAAAGLPPSLTADEFDPNALQRTLPGQSGTQRFFHTAERAFCLYVVLGSHALRGLLVKEANRLLRGITIT
jgi:hypothetical protein